MATKSCISVPKNKYSSETDFNSISQNKNLNLNERHEFSNVASFARLNYFSKNGQEHSDQGKVEVAVLKGI